MLALALGGFAIGTTEFVTMGLLPQVAEGVGVSIPTAGHVISAYALGVVIGAPLIAIFGARLPRQRASIAGRPEEHQDAFAGDLEAHLGGQPAGEALVTVGAHQPQHHVVVALVDDVPDPPVEALRPAVQGVAAVVGRELDDLAVEGEPTTGDPVGVAADRAAQVARRGQVVLGVGMAEHHVPSYAVTAGHPQPVHGRAEVEDLEHRPRFGPDRQQLHRAEGRLSEGLDAHGATLVPDGSGSRQSCPARAAHRASDAC